MSKSSSKKYYLDNDELKSEILKCKESKIASEKLGQMFYKIVENVSDIIINSDDNNPYILNISFKDVNAEALILMLSISGIYVSSGSACNSKGTEVSRVLKSIGVPKDYIYGTIRVSFSTDNTSEEIITAANEIIRCVDTQRKMRI